MSKKVWKYFFQQKKDEIVYWFKNSEGLKFFGSVLLCFIGVFTVMPLLGYLAHHFDINYILKDVLMEVGGYDYFFVVGIVAFVAILTPIAVIGGIGLAGIIIWAFSYIIFYQPFMWIKNNWKRAKRRVEQEKGNNG